MIRKERLKELPTELVTNDENFMESFRQNIAMYLREPDITMRELAEVSGLSYTTLSSFIYKDLKDAKLSTAIALSKALNVSIDELVGACTMHETTSESVRLSRTLPEHALYLVRYFIRHQYNIYNRLADKKKYISVFEPAYENGIMSTTNVVHSVCIEGIPASAYSSVYLGIQIPTNFYAPYYFKGETILIAADRPAQHGERCVITSNGGIYIVIKNKLLSDGYASITSRNMIIPDNLVDDKIGYIVGFLNVEDKWGIR